MNTVVSHSKLMPLERGVAAFVFVLLIAGLVVAVYHQSFVTIYELWKLSNYQYAFLIIPVAAYILWQSRSVLAQEPITPAWPGIMPIVALAVAWHLSRATSVQALEHIAAMMAIPAAVFAIVGTRFFSAAAFPLLLTLITIPIGELLVPPLMEVTADLSSLMLQIVGVPVQRQGMFLSLPGGDFKIADVCAGVNYLLAGSAVALLFSYWTYERASHRVFFVAIAAVVFVLGNSVRAFIVMLVASGTQLRYFAGYDHVVFGMIFFVALLLGLLWLGNRYAAPLRQRTEESSGGAAPRIDWSRCAAMFACVLLALLAGPVAQAYLVRPSSALLNVRMTLPTIASCGPATEWRASWEPQMQSADQHIAGSYHCNGFDVHLMVASYVDQQQGKELVNNDNEIVPHEWWMAGVQKQALVRLDSGTDLPVNEVSIRNGSATALTWHWYSVNGRALRATYSVKLYEALAALILRPAVSRAYVVSVASEGSDAASMQAQARVAALALLHAAE